LIYGPGLPAWAGSGRRILAAQAGSQGLGAQGGARVWRGVETRLRGLTLPEAQTVVAAHGSSGAHLGGHSILSRQGQVRTQLAAHLVAAAYNLLRIAKLTAAPA